MIDKNVFLSQAVLCICGELEIEQALSALLRYLSSIMPADRMLLQRFDRERDVIHTIAHSTPEEGRELNLLTPFSAETKAAMSQSSGTPSGLFLFEKPDKQPISREILLFHRVSASSLMLMPLISDGEMVGNVVLLTEGKEPYREEHAHVFSLLKAPLLLAMSNARTYRELLLRKEILADDKCFLQDELRRISGEEIIGVNFGLKSVMRDVRKAAPLKTPVLLLGETGVGKAAIASTLHASSCAQGPFITVNCGAIPGSVLDSELFGHEKGAFAGARSQRRGRFERAAGGTIFLDEIGELPLSAQTRVLRVLQEKNIERVGGSESIAVDCRVIAATHRDLELMVKAGQFHEELWSRLNDFPIIIPPLRERTSDIPALLQHFIRENVHELNLLKIPKIAPGVIDRLLNYYWPGNVRELANVVEREIILNPRGPLTFLHINPADSVPQPQPQIHNIGSVPQTQAQTQAQNRQSHSLPHVQPQNHSSEPVEPVQQDVQSDRIETLPAAPAASNKLDDVVKHHIQQILQKTGGKIHGPGGAAELLDINANTLRNRMNKLGINYRRKSKSNEYFID